MGGANEGGNRWSRELAGQLAERLAIDDERRVVTTSGTDALRLAVVATAGAARPGQAAAVPSFTFPATAEAVAQLGYEVRFVDVDPNTWTMEPPDLERVVADAAVRVVVVVDTFGNPADYDAIREVCEIGTSRWWRTRQPHSGRATTGGRSEIRRTPTPSHSASRRP